MIYDFYNSHVRGQKIFLPDYIHQQVKIITNGALCFHIQYTSKVICLLILDSYYDIWFYFLKLSFNLENLLNIL